MLFGVGKVQPRLADGTAGSAEQPGDIDHQFNLLMADRQRLECASRMAIADHMPASATWADHLVGVNGTVEDRLAVKKSVQRC